jgi:hypothetical protein
MAYVLTSLSGNLISAASAAYAPTNSADVSAIASAYAADKQDASAMSAYALSSDVSGVIDTVSSNSASWGGGGSTIATGEFLGYSVVSADNGVSVVGNSGVVSSSVSVPYTDTTWATNTISANSNKSQFRIYNFSRTAGNMPSLPTGKSVRIRVTAATPNQSVYDGDQIHLIVYTGTNSGSPVGNWQVQSIQSYKSAIWDKTVTWNSTNQPNMLITAENYNTYTFGTTAKYSAVGTGSSASESSYTADILAASPGYVSSVVSGVIDTVSSNSASWGGGGGGGVDSATVSAIASSYAESAVSSKLDASASSDFYSTSNPSGFITGIDLSNYATTAYVDSSISSFVDSAYVDSQVSGKQDASAMTSYALSSDVSGVIDTVSSNSASWAGGITGDYLTSKVGSGQATFSTAFQDGMEKRPSLVIAAERSKGAKMYPRMMVTDWNDTTGDTHSGTLLSNAFEFYICPQSARGEVAPSGIVQSRLDASRLQFNVDPAVSSFTKSSEFTRSGMQLGMSGNSASWVTISGNGTSGGLITLDDCSGTTGRIVASSISYWDGKLDGSASSSFYTTANESGYVDSAYVESHVSSKQDTLTFDWDADSAISSINGSALAGQGGGGSQVQSDWIESSTAEPSYIQNKPAVFGLLAGAGVKITESASAITIATEIPTYDTTTDVGKVLQVTVNGLAWVSLS